MSIAHPNIRLPDTLLRDRTLSWTALGIFGYMLTYPEDKTFQAEEIDARYKGTRTGEELEEILDGLQRLTKAGYITYEDSKKSEGQSTRGYRRVV